MMRYLWLPYVWLYDLRLFVADLAAIHFRDEFMHLRSERAGVQRDPSNIARVAVVAIHPTDDTIPFTQNLLAALTANNFYVLVVYNNPMSAAQQAAILPYCHYLIEGFSVGRDFGAYKRGLIWLTENGKLSNASIVVLANDSMFYPSSLSETVSEMLSLSEDWGNPVRKFSVSPSCTIILSTVPASCVPVALLAEILGPIQAILVQTTLYRKR